MIEFNATFIVAMLSFVVFMFIMNAIFYNPVLKIIRKREEYISNNYNEAKILENKALDYQNEKEEKLKNTRIECRLQIESAIEQAQIESNKKTIEQKEKTKAQIQSDKEKLMSEAKELKDAVNSTIVKDLANSVTDKILKMGREINA